MHRLACDASVFSAVVAGNLAAPFQQGYPPVPPADRPSRAADICRRRDATISDFTDYAI